jgi:hypothetical protein
LKAIPRKGKGKKEMLVIEKRGKGKVIIRSIKAAPTKKKEKK